MSGSSPSAVMCNQVSRPSPFLNAFHAEIGILLRISVTIRLFSCCFGVAYSEMPIFPNENPPIKVPSVLYRSAMSGRRMGILNIVLILLWRGPFLDFR